METWMWIVAALLAGMALGAGGTALFRRRAGADRQALDRLRREFDDYRREVGDHFVETASLVNDLTRSYKAVYDHLERGAYRLVGEETLHRRLENVQSETVMLEYIGSRDARAVMGTRAVADEGAEPATAPSVGESPDDEAAADSGAISGDPTAAAAASGDEASRPET